MMAGFAPCEHLFTWDERVTVPQIAINWPILWHFKSRNLIKCGNALHTIIGHTKQRVQQRTIKVIVVKTRIMSGRALSVGTRDTHVDSCGKL